MDDQVKQAKRAILLRSPQQIRGDFLFRLGIPPSPKVRVHAPTNRRGQRGASPISVKVVNG